MTDLDFLLKFRRCTTSDSLERLYDKLNFSLHDDDALMDMYRAADHRRAEIIAGKLFNLGSIPKELWRQVK